MYDPIKIQKRMADLVLNPLQLSKRARVSDKTATHFMQTGRGYSKTSRRLLKALKFENPSEILLSERRKSA